MQTIRICFGDTLLTLTSFSEVSQDIFTCNRLFRERWAIYINMTGRLYGIGQKKLYLNETDITPLSLHWLRAGIDSYRVHLHC